MYAHQTPLYPTAYDMFAIFDINQSAHAVKAAMHFPQRLNVMIFKSRLAMRQLRGCLKRWQTTFELV